MNNLEDTNIKFPAPIFYQVYQEGAFPSTQLLCFNYFFLYPHSLFGKSLIIEQLFKVIFDIQLCNY